MDRDLFGDTPVDLSLAILREYEPPEGYWGAFSGGKDSVVLKRLVELAGVKCDWHFNVTTIDPPEVLRFIRDYHADVVWEKPKKSFCALIRAGRGLPTRVARWCCQELKETGGVGRLVVTGVRAAESARRAQYGVVTPCQRLKKTLVAPILHWTDAQVWQFIRSEGLPYCGLYDEGFKRIGCLFCPMSRPWKRRREMERWPRQWARIVAAAEVGYAAMPSVQARFGSAEEWLAWWVGDGSYSADRADQEVFPLDQFDDEEEAAQ